MASTWCDNIDCNHLLYIPKFLLSCTQKPFLQARIFTGWNRMDPQTHWMLLTDISQSMTPHWQPPFHLQDNKRLLTNDTTNFYHLSQQVCSSSQTWVCAWTQHSHQSHFRVSTLWNHFQHHESERSLGKQCIPTVPQEVQPNFFLTIK